LKLEVRELSLTYFIPSTLSEALSYLGQHKGVRIIAGGTDLLVKNYDKLDSLEGLMDISGLSELKDIQTGEKVRIGSLVTHGTIADHPWLQQYAPILCQGSAEVGAPQIRNRGTLGGNIANGSPAADIAPPLIVLGAQVELNRSGLMQTVPMGEFFTGPGMTVLERDQLITGVTFAKPRSNQGGSYIKLGKRKAMAIATASIAVLVTVDNEKLTDIIICMGSVAPVPLRTLKTEGILRGQSLNSLPLAEAGRQLRSEITPIDDIRGTAEYRRQVAGVILERALLGAIRNAGVDLDG